MSAKTESLGGAFTAPTREDWAKLAEKALKGKSPADFVTTTTDGVHIRPLYVAGDAEAISLRRGENVAGPGRWDIRSRIDNPSPAAAQTETLEDLEGGASSVLIAIDASGADGVAITDAAGLAQVLTGVEIELAPVALDAGFAGPLAAQWLGAAAKRSPRARLAFHMDPLSAFARAGTSPGPIAAHIEFAAQTAAKLDDDYPLSSAFLATGRVLHEAGASDAHELAFAAAAAVVYLKAQVASGTSVQRALQNIVLGVSVDGEFLTGVAKVRALRLIWDQIAAACEVALPAQIEARSSQRVLSKLDSWTNLLRLTAAGFAAAVGGADSVVLAAFTQPFGAGNDLSRRQARNTQLVLLEEAHLARVQDPASGAWSLDAQTRELAEAAWALFQTWEAAGGAAEVLRSGAVAEAVKTNRDARQAAYAEGAAKMIGVNLFKSNLDTPLELAPRQASAKPGPNVALTGADDACPELAPVRWAQSFETQ